MEVLKPCWAVATSGVPVRKQLFNASICHHTHVNLFQHGDFARSFGRTINVGSLEVATPILLHRGEPRGGLHNQEAIWRWQLSTGATWSNFPSPSGMMEAMAVPTLKPLSLGVHDKQEVIIAAGDQEAVVIFLSGSVSTPFELPGPPTHTLILEDFSGDGLIDAIVVTSAGVYGFVQTRQLGALFFSTLVRCLIVIMVVIFVSQYLISASKNQTEGVHGLQVKPVKTFVIFCSGELNTLFLHPARPQYNSTEHESNYMEISI